MSADKLDALIHAAAAVARNARAKVDAAVADALIQATEPESWRETAGAVFGVSVGAEAPEVVELSDLKRIGGLTGKDYFTDAKGREMRLDGPLFGPSSASHSPLLHVTRFHEGERNQRGRPIAPPSETHEYFQGTFVPVGTYVELSARDAARRAEAGRLAAAKAERQKLAAARQVRWAQWQRGEIDWDQVGKDAD